MIRHVGYPPLRVHEDVPGLGRVHGYRQPADTVKAWLILHYCEPIYWCDRSDESRRRTEQRQALAASAAAMALAGYGLVGS